MEIGTIVEGRYVLEARVGAGGMGTLYRATDRQTGQPVALKVLTDPEPDVQRRFSREIRVLAGLSHPAIVRYVGHGAIASGRPFLAMEWLQGQDLHDRLAERPLTVEESIAIARRTAEALAAAHDEGVVHRDLKPSNIFLVQGDPRRLKVLDFGVARRLAGTRALTSTGAMVGTVGYMAPEQLQGTKDVDARADVFALGCMLFECLAGERAFPGHNALAVLAKLLIDDVPRVTDLRPDMPEALDRLLGCWMAKAPQERPAEGRQALRMLEGLGNLCGATPARPLRTSVQAGERRIVNAVVVEREVTSSQPTRTPTREAKDRGQLAKVIGAHGGELATVGEGMLVVLLRGGGAATDQAARAASCALALRDPFPDAKVVVTTGRADTGRPIPVGPVIDAAVELLAQARPRQVRLDGLTSELVRSRFRVEESFLIAEREAVTPVRRLLGKPTPFVGRKKELRLLEATLEDCTEEGRAQSVLLTAPAGTGKTRLQHEFVASLRDRADLRVLFARGNPVGAGSALMLARQLIQSALDGLDPHAGDARTQLVRRLEPLPLEEPMRVADFLGEVLGLATTHEPSPQLQAARSDAQIMAEWLERSFLQWLAALAERSPVLLVLEDLHWGDNLTVSYLDRLFRERRDRSLMVVVTARPEVHERFPRLWGGVELHEVRLQGLGARAAEQLVRSVMGETLPTSEVQRLVQLADGNAFYLEELVRHAAKGGGTLPDTVLAMVDGRLGDLESDARRVLRAASILGEQFRGDAVAALLADDTIPVDVPGWLDVLADRELLEPLASGEHEEGPTHAFRHALLRESAYEMLTDEDRIVGHRLAGEWLQARGCDDPLLLLHHFERAADRERTVHYAVEAAQRALDRGDYEQTARVATKGLGHDPEGEARGRLLLLYATAVGWQSDFESAMCIREAIELLPAGSSSWTQAVNGTLYLGVTLVRQDIVLEALNALMSFTGIPELTPAYARGIWIATVALLDTGHAPMARGLMEPLRQRLATVDEGAAHGWLECTLGYLTLTHDHDPGRALAHAARGIEIFERLGDPMGAALAQTLEILTLFEVGRFDQASALAEKHPNPQLGGQWTHEVLVRAEIDLLRGRAEAARSSVAAAFDTEARFAGPARAIAAVASFELGEHGEANEQMARALALSESMSYGPTVVLAMAAHLALNQGEAEVALARADDGLTRAEAGMCYPRAWLGLSLARAEALMALGRPAEAREAIDVARTRLDAVCAHLSAEYRDGLVRAHPWHARIAQLAASWGGG